MSQIETKPLVIISVFKENMNPSDIERITPQIKNLVDSWQRPGNIMGSGPFNDCINVMLNG